MKFENLRESYVASEKDSVRYMYILSSLIRGIYEGVDFKGRNLHEEVQNDIRKYIKGKYDKEVHFRYQPPQKMESVIIGKEVSMF